MNSIVWSLMQVIALLVQIIFLINIYLNLLPLYKAGKLGTHLKSGDGFMYATFLFCCAVYIGFLFSQSPRDHATQFAGFRIFGVGQTLFGLLLTFYSNSAKKKLLAS